MRADRPNVLFLLTEDQGAHLSMLATAGLDTPHMDAIASNGVYFKEAFVNYPVCSASKANMVTGMHSHTNRINFNTVNYFKPAASLTPAQTKNPIYTKLSIPPNVPTLVEQMREGGYLMAISAKLHLSPNERFPYEDWIRVATGPRLTEVITKAKRQSRPWFFWCNMGPPHRPFRNSDLPNVKLTVDSAEVEPPGHLPDTPVARKDWAEYLDHVEQADRRIGGLMDALKKSGAADNTIVIFMGDHGPAYHRGKVSPYDFGLRVPFAFSGPGIVEGIVHDEIVSAIDLMPTILDLVDLPCPKRLHGRSLAPLLRGEVTELEGRDYVVSEVHHGTHTGDNGQQERSVYDGRYRLIYREGVNKPRDFNADLRYWRTPHTPSIEWRNRVFDDIVEHRDEYPMAYRLLDEMCTELPDYLPQRVELYDVKNDPHELTNLIERSDMADVRDRLIDMLLQHIRETKDRDVNTRAVRRLAASVGR